MDRLQLAGAVRGGHHRYSVAPAGPSALLGPWGGHGALQSFIGVGWCIECGSKAHERLSYHVEPDLLNQQFLGGQTSRLQPEVGAGEARGAYGTVDQGLILGCHRQVQLRRAEAGTAQLGLRAILAGLVDGGYHWVGAPAGWGLGPLQDHGRMYALHGFEC